jgi:hypothetical protein
LAIRSFAERRNDLAGNRQRPCSRLFVESEDVLEALDLVARRCQTRTL